MAILVALALALQETTPPAPSPETPPNWLEFFHGHLRTMHRSRWTSGASDSDLFNFLSIRAGNAEKDLYSGAASGRFQSDLDGDRGADGFSPFDSLSDSYRRATSAQVLTAYIDVTNPWPGVRLRAGRQILDEMPEAVPMDGALASLEASPEVRFAAFGGRPVNYFESSPSGDAMFGGWIEAKPWTRSRARLEYLHLEDENTFGLFKDDLIGLMIEQGEGPWLLSARATILESEARDILLRGSAAYPEAGLTLDLRTYYLFEQQQALSYGLDSFALFLLPVEPYYQFSLGASQELSERFGVDATVVTRRLENADDEGDYNHEFSRWGFTVRSRKWPVEDLSVSVTGDFWQTRDDDFWTAGGAIQWQAAESIRVDLSSSYTLYTIDALTGEERERVRLVSLGIRWKVNPDVTADAKFTAEENDVDGFRTLDVGVRYAF
ncbi:MAG TPA: hypothetical protein VJU16_00790 [Planctomycetota bacterium]|nr:hypothetical protein [Planctomycetota bacterium]